MSNRKDSHKGGQVAASFRDPAGFIFTDEKGTLLRQVNKAGAEDFDFLTSSKLYDALTEKNLLIPHQNLSTKDYKGVHAVIQPDRIPFISYPFEWSFSQLQDAALLTIRIQRLALEHDMTLKDATAYNVQFIEGKPVFIDTLSFEKYTAGSPWKAYKQFCQHFLAPLSLMAYTDLNLSQLLRVHLDGIPLELAAKLLPRKARLRMGLTMHLFLHARAQKAKASEHKRQSKQIRKEQLLAILSSLERTVQKLRPLNYQTEWGDYYNNTNYSAGAADTKATMVRSFVKKTGAKTVIDFGGNNGTYSRVLNAQKIVTVCSDIDPNAVEANYRYARKHNEKLMLPVLIDLTNPGGGLGWHNAERSVVHERYQTDAAMALAIIHHLAISNNLPFAHIAKYFATFAPYLVIEFVPKEDSQVKKLLSTREDIFPDYHEEGFKKGFGAVYNLVKEEKIKGTKRTLYLFERK